MELYVKFKTEIMFFIKWQNQKLIHIQRKENNWSNVIPIKQIL